jgi:hypothetical protein
MQWKPFSYRGEIYDLAHLHPRSVTYEQPAKGDAPARVYRVDVIKADWILCHSFQYAE